MSIRRNFFKVYDKINSIGDEPFVMPFWDNVNKQVLNEFKPVPPVDFLSCRALIDTMFVVGDQKWLDTQINYLKKHLGVKYKKMIKEDSIGSPKIIDNIGTSHNTIHHIYHLLFFNEKTGVSFSKINTVIEWGGGYGNMAKLWKKHFNKESTYIIIDTSLFCSIQWLYLSSVLGKNNIHLLSSRNCKIRKGAINLVPIALLDELNIKGDLFVSTWGLSESKKEAQDFVMSKKWFGCKNILIGFQDSTPELKHASRLGKLAKNDGAKIINIEFIPNNHYALK